MAATLKVLAQGQLPNSKTTLYTCPALTQALITDARLVNTGAADRTVNIYAKTSGGTSRRLIAKDLTLPPNVPYAIRGGQVIEAGGVIEGDASAAAEVDYYFSGVEFA